MPASVTSTHSSPAAIPSNPAVVIERTPLRPTEQVFVESAGLGRSLARLAEEQREIDRRALERLAALRRLQDRD